MPRQDRLTGKPDDTEYAHGYVEFERDGHQWNPVFYRSPPKGKKVYAVRLPVPQELVAGVVHAEFA